jgi:Flp pilus assembly protein TadG
MPANHSSRKLLRCGSSRTASAAVEFALVSPILALLLVNVVDYSMLIWDQMQVDDAAEVGAQAAYRVPT